jgi:hypothetical protein
MFENAQQEPSGGSTKVIGGVLVVAVIVIAAVWFLVFRHADTAAPAAAPAGPVAGAANTPVPDANFRMDLVVLRGDLSRDPTQTQAIWNIQISNRSREITYKNIKYATNYYDGGGNVIQQGSGTLDDIGPGQQRSFTGLNDGLYPPATSRFGVELTSAEGFKP